MSNVVMLTPPLRQDEGSRLARLVNGFATQRRGADDVFWLKENAELLGILAATGTKLGADALDPFRGFYQELPERLAFFPQYYRFLLSLGLDLEDLGMPGDLGTHVAQYVADHGLAQAELSDLQRAEARRLLARRGVVDAPDAGLTRRLRHFMSRAETFALPNKKAAYELTHIVFYLSEYGQRDPQLDRAAQTSLTYAGLLAYLDQNVDLLAEVCTAQRFAGMTPPVQWEQAIARAHQGIALTHATDAAPQDAYHEYLVTGWALHVAGGQAFTASVPEGPVRFALNPTRGALRSLSECMFGLGSARSGDWGKMRPLVLRRLEPDGQALLAEAEQSTDQFEPFFETFARAGAG